MAHWYRTFGVAFGALLGLFWVQAALAQCTQPSASGYSGLQLTPAGTASGFGLSTFACGFPNDDNNSATGPSGSVGTGAGNVLVTDTATFSATAGVADVMVSLSPATCISDGGCNIGSGNPSGDYATPSGEYSAYTALTGSVQLGQVTSAVTTTPGCTSGGGCYTNPEYAGDVGSTNLDHTQTNGANPTSACENCLGTLSNGDIYAVATVPYTATNLNNELSNPVTPSDLLVIGTGPESNAPGVYDYNGTLTKLISDEKPGLDALAVSNDGNTVYVGSDDSSAGDAIEGFTYDSSDEDYDITDFTVTFSALCGGDPDCTGVTGLYTLQTGDLAGDLLAETADDIELVCTVIGDGCQNVGEVVQIATGGSGGGAIGNDFNTIENLGNLNGCLATDPSAYDVYTCAETVYLPQSRTLDQLTYSGGALPPEVPEPASLSLFTAALAGLGFLRRREAAA